MVSLAVDLLLVDALRRGVGSQQVLHDADQEAAGAAGRVADGLGRLRVQHLHHQVDDVARRAELAVDAGRGELASRYS